MGRYRVDRQKSVDVLKAFLKNRDSKIAQERDWLHIVRADCVLSDAAFLGWFVLTLRVHLYSNYSRVAVQRTPPEFHPF